MKDSRSLPRIAVVVALSLIAVPVFVAATAPLPAPQVDFSSVKEGDYVVIQKRRGGTVEGEVVGVDSNEIQIKGKYGKFPVRKDDIESIQVRESNEKVYERRSKEAKTADDWFAIGQWADSVNEPDLAQKAYRKAVSADSDHAGAREALGEIKHDGVWMPAEEAYRRQGRKQYKGEWLTPEEIEKRREEARAKVRDEKQRGQEDLAREYRGRPWADVEPIETDNYWIFCNSTEEVAREYARNMEALYKRYNQIFGRLPRYKESKGRVYIHANHQQFMDWCGVEQGIGGFYKPWNTDVTAYHGSFGMTGSTYEVLAHEGTHQFQGFILKDFRACPMWMIEGLAVFFGDGSELKSGEVEIGIIPQDRLVGLRRFIEQDRYWRLDDFALTGQPYPGAFYASAWGVVYWCLWGNRVKDAPKAHDGEGLKVMEEYLVHVTQGEGPCDYREELKFFKKLLTDNTDYNTVEEWEEDYKNWILSLPLKELGKKKGGGRWVSERLAVEVRKPSGWRYVDADDRYSRLEVVAFERGGSSHRRVSTYVWPNWQKADLSIPAMKAVLNNLVKVDELAAGFDGDEVEDGMIEAEIHGYSTVHSKFTGTRIAEANSSVGTGDGDSKADNNAESVKRKYHVVFYATFDRIYANVLETDVSEFEANENAFDKYLKEFKIN